jgi:hypothetical protein
MRFLVTDFETSQSTEAAYLSHELNEYEDHQSILISPRDSIYDYGDKFRPDFIISSLNALSRATIDYLSDNKHIKFILHTGDSLLKRVLEIESLLIDKNINCAFMFNNIKPIITKEIPFVRVGSGADIGLINSKTEKHFKYPKALFLTKNATYNHISQFFAKDEMFHVLTNVKSDGHIDIYRPENLMIPLYRSYDEIIFIGLSDNLPQAFLDTLAMGIKTYYISESNKVKEAISKVLGSGIDLDYNSPSRCEDFSSIRQTVITKHTSINRAKSILSQIPKS